MKGSRLYMLILCIFLVAVFLFEYMAPHQFVWRETYDHNDREPFGCYVFDDVAQSSLTNYSTTYQTVYQIYKADTTVSERAFLITEKSLNLNQNDVRHLYKLLHAGNKVMICAENFSYSLEDTLCFSTDYDGYMESLQDYLKGDKQRDSIFLYGKRKLTFAVYPQIHRKHLILSGQRSNYDDGTADTCQLNCRQHEILSRDDDDNVLAVRCLIGKGELILVSTPLMFSNFGILDESNAAYAFGLLAYLGNRPVTRIEAYGSHSEKAGSPLRYVLSILPLRWAIYSALTLLVLFMIFTARRRQRVIPIVAPPPNRSFGFMQLISNLYYQHHNNAEMLKIKYLYFCSEIKRLAGIDLYGRDPEESDFQRLSEKTGIDCADISTLLRNINLSISRYDVSDPQFMKYIDGINNVLRKLRN